MKLRTEKCRLCTTKNDKAFVVQEVIFHTYYTRFYVSHLKRGRFSSIKKSSTYFHILGPVVYAMSILQIRQQHKEKIQEHNKNVALSSADVGAMK